MFMSARGGAKGSLEKSYLILMATRFYDPVRSKSTEHGFTLWNCESTMINTAVEPPRVTAGFVLLVKRCVIVSETSRWSKNNTQLSVVIHSVETGQ